MRPARKMSRRRARSRRAGGTARVGGMVHGVARRGHYVYAVIFFVSIKAETATASKRRRSSILGHFASRFVDLITFRSLKRQLSLIEIQARPDQYFLPSRRTWWCLASTVSALLTDISPSLSPFRLIPSRIHRGTDRPHDKVEKLLAPKIARGPALRLHTAGGLCLPVLAVWLASMAWNSRSSQQAGY